MENVNTEIPSVLWYYHYFSVSLTFSFKMSSSCVYWTEPYFHRDTRICTYCMSWHYLQKCYLHILKCPFPYLASFLTIYNSSAHFLILLLFLTKQLTFEMPTSCTKPQLTLSSEVSTTLFGIFKCPLTFPHDNSCK